MRYLMDRGARADSSLLHATTVPFASRLCRCYASEHKCTHHLFRCINGQGRWWVSQQADRGSVCWWCVLLLYVLHPLESSEKTTDRWSRKETATDGAHHHPTKVQCPCPNGQMGGIAHRPDLPLDCMPAIFGGSAAQFQNQETPLRILFRHRRICLEARMEKWKCNVSSQATLIPGMPFGLLQEYTQ